MDYDLIKSFMDVKKNDITFIRQIFSNIKFFI